eukprot:GDKI01038122.1.p1 GENE.GDKI01038122.1~~GDKI01038122.1.p1  ORF type:complete len:670 (+),score=208.27 GDKI01038122.1:47-2056(+)
MTLLNLKEICKRRVLDEMVRRVHSAEGYIAMIVDDRTLRVLSACCRVSDILEEGVTVVENIRKKRQPLPKLDAIYFIAPEQPSIDALLKDFAHEKKPQYKNVHLFFSSKISKESGIMERIAGDPRLLPRIKSFVEFNFNFIAYEQRVFHFDTPGALRTLFPLQKPEVLHDICDKILSVCGSLSERPYVRYCKSSLPVCEQLAKLASAKMMAFFKNVPTRQNRATLLIVDRSVDCAAPFMHEYSYQALMYDLLDVPVCEVNQKALQAAPSAAAGSGSKKKDPPKPGERRDSMEDLEAGDSGEPKRMDDCLEYEVETSAQKTEKKTAVFGEHDELWVRFRHKHISEVSQQVTEEIKNLVRSNAAAKVQMGQKVTVEAVRSLPKYQELLAKYWMHVAMTERCFKRIDERRIRDIGFLEHDLATGVDRDGAAVSPTKLLTALGTVLSDPNVKPEDKLRLVMLYFTQMDGIKEEDRRKVMEAARFDTSTQSMILQFLRMNLHRAYDPPESAKAPSGKHQHRADKERIKYFKQRVKNAQYEHTRFEPALKEVIERCASNSLDKVRYPYVEEPGATTTAGPIKAAAAPKAIAAAGGMGATKEKGKATQWDWGHDAPAPVEEERERVIVFVLGGVCMSEMRCAYEVSAAKNVDVVIGSTSIITSRHIFDLCADDGRL